MKLPKFPKQNNHKFVAFHHKKVDLSDGTDTFLLLRTKEK